MANWTLVTGASRGLGRGFAHRAAEDGRKVILSARNEAELHEVAAELRRKGVEAMVIPADLSRIDEVERLWREATNGRQIDVLVNNAGLGRNGKFAEGGWDREHASIQVNLEALTRLCKLAVPHMKEARGGRILNVASLAGFMPGPGMAVYHATKAYVISLSDALAQELKGTGVSVTALCPGVTESNFLTDADMDSLYLVRFGITQKTRTVVNAGWRAAMRGRRVVVTGPQNKLLALVTRVTPRQIVGPIAQFLLARRK